MGCRLITNPISAFINQWTHIGVTLVSNTLSIYVNGKVADTSTLTYLTINRVIRQSEVWRSARIVSAWRTER